MKWYIFVISYYRLSTLVFHENISPCKNNWSWVLSVSPSGVHYNTDFSLLKGEGEGGVKCSTRRWHSIWDLMGFGVKNLSISLVESPRRHALLEARLSGNFAYKQLILHLSLQLRRLSSFYICIISKHPSTLHSLHNKQRNATVCVPINWT